MNKLFATQKLRVNRWNTLPSFINREVKQGWRQTIFEKQDLLRSSEDLVRIQEVKNALQLSIKQTNPSLL